MATLWFCDDKKEMWDELHDIVRNDIDHQWLPDIAAVWSCVDNLQAGDAVSLDSQMPERTGEIVQVDAGLQAAAIVRASGKEVHLYWHSKEQLPSLLQAWGVKEGGGNLKKLKRWFQELTSEPDVLVSVVGEAKAFLLQERLEALMGTLWILASGYRLAARKGNLRDWFAPLADGLKATVPSDNDLLAWDESLETASRQAILSLLASIESDRWDPNESAELIAQIESGLSRRFLRPS